MRAVHLISACALACLLMETAHAADNGVYAGLSIGQSSTDFPDEVGDFFDDNDTAFKLVVGLRPMDWWAVEVAYVDLGEVTQQQDIPEISNFKLEESGFGAFGLLLYDISWSISSHEPALCAGTRTSRQTRLSGGRVAVRMGRTSRGAWVLS